MRPYLTTDDAVNASTALNAARRMMVARIGLVQRKRGMTQAMKQTELAVLGANLAELIKLHEALQQAHQIGGYRP